MIYKNSLSYRPNIKDKAVISCFNDGMVVNIPSPEDNPVKGDRKFRVDCWKIKKLKNLKP